MSYFNSNLFTVKFQSVHRSLQSARPPTVKALQASLLWESLCFLWAVNTIAMWWKANNTRSLSGSISGDNGLQRKYVFHETEQCGWMSVWQPRRFSQQPIVDAEYFEIDFDGTSRTNNQWMANRSCSTNPVRINCLIQPEAVNLRPMGQIWPSAGCQVALVSSS